jgi:hypothetical protein
LGAPVAASIVTELAKEVLELKGHVLALSKEIRRYFRSKDRGGNKILKCVYHRPAFASLRTTPESRTFYERKRAEGKRHLRALIAPASRLSTFLWARLSDGKTFALQSAACHLIEIL